MSDSPGNGHYVPCPLCEGKGKMQPAELIAKLANHEIEAQLAACREQLMKQEAGRTTDPEQDFKQEVLKGPVTRILWRRSPKE